jgi:catechol 2,3-dioxygenase-like lactoylglutathione lyase family enzyme
MVTPPPDEYAVSPAIGPLPAVYVHRPAPIGGTMSDIPADLQYSPDHPPRAGLMEYQIQVVTVPVTDVDQAAAFYTQQAGFALDVDYHPAGDFRVVQLTPPGSACSVQIGTGLTDAAPGSARGTYLAVTDIEAAWRELTGRGVKVSAIRHKAPVGDWKGGFAPGTDPDRRDYASFADFADPDGNTWVLQEIGYRGTG